MSLLHMQRIMSGDGGIDVDLLKRCTEYQGCNSKTDIICWLWTILEEFDEVLITILMV